MDSKTLEQLQTALSTVLTDEAQLQAAVTAVQTALPVTPVVDQTWVAVQAALIANGWTPAITMTDTSRDGELAPNTPSAEPDQPTPTV